MTTIIIPTKNEQENLPCLLESLENQTYKRFDVLIIDGKSKDNTLKIAEKYGCKIVIQKKLGISNARNLGWKNAKSDLLIFLEADQNVDKNFIKEISKIFRHSNIKVARANYIPIEGNWIQKALSIQIGLASKRQKSSEFPTIFRKEVLTRTGGWNEEIDFAEDRELPTRLRDLGYKTILIKDAIVYAKPVDSLAKLFRQGRWYGRNIFGYVSKTRDFVTLLGILIYSAFLPLLIMSLISNVFAILLIFDLFVLFIYSLKGFMDSKSPYAFLMIPINIVRGFGELIGMIESSNRKGRGKL